MLPIDEYAREIAVRKFALPPCLHIPVAARSEAAIRRYIGSISAVLAPGGTNKAFVVELHEIPTLDDRLPIWRLPETAILHAPRQVWVHVDYRCYRKAYCEAFPAQDIKGLVLDHVMNRRVARLKGFPYVRLVAIARAANSSSGGLSEKWAVEYHSKPEVNKWNKESSAEIQYADLADIVKMLSIKTGGALQDPVNEAQALLKRE